MKTLSRRADLDEVIARIRGVREDSPRAWGTMSPNEMLCHVADTFRFGLGEISARTPTGSAKLRLMKMVVLNMPFHWPHGVPTGAPVDPKRDGTKPASFAADKDRLIGLCVRFATTPMTSALLHPFFGPMSESEWQRWAYLHTDHHLRQFGV